MLQLVTFQTCGGARTAVREQEGKQILVPSSETSSAFKSRCTWELEEPEVTRAWYEALGRSVGFWDVKGAVVSEINLMGFGSCRGEMDGAVWCVIEAEISKNHPELRVVFPGQSFL